MSRGASDNRREGQASHFIDDRKFRGKNSRPMKGYSEPMEEPPRRRKRRKTVKLWKDEAAVERGRKGAATRKANAGARAAQSEHERRSAAARKGWAGISKEERSAIARAGWDTRYARQGVSREDRTHERQARGARDQRRRRVPKDSNPFARFAQPDNRGRAPF